MTNTIKNTHRSENDIHFKSRRNNPSCIFTKDKCTIKIFKETITVSNNREVQKLVHILFTNILKNIERLLHFLPFFPKKQSA